MTAVDWRTIGLLCVLSLGAVGSVAAQGAPKPDKAASPELTAAFTSADKDRDKSLSPFEARHMPEVVGQFAKYDANHDGFMSFDEFMSAKNGGKPAAKK
jgi:hypothetical protein